MAAPQIKQARLLKSFSMPIEAAVFNGVPSITALKQLPKANVLLAAAMDRRVVACDLSQNGPNRLPAKHLNWSHDNWIHSLDVHPDGVRVATGGTDRQIRLWQWGQDKPLASIKAHDDCVRAVAFSPDGKLLASAGDDGRARLWEVATARPIATLAEGCSFLDTLAWSNDGKQLHASGHSGKVHTFNIGSNQKAREVDVDNRRNIEDEPLNGGFSYPGGIRRMVCSPDGKMIAAAGLTSLVVLEAATGKQLLRQEGRAFGVAFDATSRRLAWSPEKALMIWDFQAGGVTYNINVDQLGLFGISFLEGGRQLATGGCNGWLGLWDVPA